MNEPTKPSRQSRWFQFSLRALFVLMLVVAAYCAGIATSEKRARKAVQDARDKAAAEIANAQEAAMLAGQRAAPPAMTFQLSPPPVATYPGLRMDVPSLGPMPVMPPSK